MSQYGNWYPDGDRYEDTKKIEKRDREIDKTLNMFKILKACQKFDDIGCQYVDMYNRRIYRRNNIYYEFHFDGYYSKYVQLFNLNGEHILNNVDWWDERSNYCDECGDVNNEDNYKKISIEDIIELPLLQALKEKQFKE